MIPVGRYLPAVIPAGGKITIGELLQHRSGLAAIRIVSVRRAGHRDAASGDWLDIGLRAAFLA
jgi:CubicO group peptidase (beta-lactamase class C family)